VVIHKESLGAALAGVNAHILSPPELAGERSFGAHLLGDMELKGRESLPDEVSSQLEMFVPPPGECLH
jgi:hypothetical protein